MNHVNSDNKSATNSFAISLILHTIILSLLAFVKLSPNPTTVQASTQLPAKIKTVSRLIEKAQILPKPKIINQPLSKTGKMPRFSLNQNSKPIFPASAEAVTTQSLPSKNLTACNVPGTTDLNFFGNPVRDRRLCFVVDCSGSMQGTFERVKVQLKNFISGLEPDRYFQIIFFGDNQLYGFNKNGLMRASNPIKQNAIKFIDTITPKGRTNALEALTSAMQNIDSAVNSPNVIYFLTDGFNLAEGNNNNLLMSILTFRSNHCAETKFNTIGFWPKPQDEVILKQLAEMTGGTFTLIKK
jgi:uncharacterized protein YegL